MGLLALEYRPKRFSDLVGQDSARVILQALVFGGDMPPALIFEGTRGAGKTSTARILASALNCAAPVNGDNCSECESCLAIRSGESMSVHEIDAASNGGIDDIRNLKDLAQFSTGDKWRVILLDEAHAMSKNAFNALLKVLEEPPPFTVFVLLTTEPDKIMETVRSRSMPIIFKPVTVPHIISRLQFICESEGFSFSKDVLKEIADGAGGSLRDAIMLLDQASRVGVDTIQSLRTITGKTDLSSKIMQAVCTQNYGEANHLVGEYFTTSGDASALVSDLIEQTILRYNANAINPRQMVTAVKLLWEARTIPAGASRDSRLKVEAVIALLFGAFYVEPVNKNPSQPILKVKESKSKPTVEELTLERLVAIAEKE